MVKESSSANRKTRSSGPTKTPTLTSKHTAKSNQQRAVSGPPPGKTLGQKKKKPAKPLPEWSEQDDEEFQGLLNNMLSKRKREVGSSTASPTSQVIARRNAIHTRRASLRVNDSEGDAEEGENDEADEEEEDEGVEEDEEDETNGGVEDEGSAAEDVDERAMKETDPDLDEEEEIEMRTVKGKGKGKAKTSGSIKFAALIMLRRKFREDGESPKPTAQEIETLENCGFAVTRTREPWLELPSNATYEELDQVFGEMLPDPFEHLRERATGDTAVWELLIPRNRTLRRRAGDALPDASDIQHSWTLGRAIRDKKIYIAPRMSFSKRALAKWGFSVTEAKAPISTSSAGPSNSRKRKMPSPELDAKENHEVMTADNEQEDRRKRRRIDAENSPVITRSRSTAQDTSSKLREEIDLTLDESTETMAAFSPLREKQLPRIFVHKSPSKEFNPYTDPGCYFK
ncbi:hypothetical protein M407DRAFT_153716 [Tulasnella calospora MUT 4182]|uniref:Uncharacterized protein n=1 Tax=Tulasnella calospora MUT 4182 TaxID=1051891 RepID=A0A0C3QRI1_9AGAM|nr:hypothetical protein M407DRAFT_153716 [Tulasnella calospora MUT 4182]